MIPHIASGLIYTENPQHTAVAGFLLVCQCQTRPVFRQLIRRIYTFIPDSVRAR